MNGPPALFLPNLRGGGAEKMAIALVRGFAQCGVHCRLVLANDRSDYERPRDIDIVNLGCPRLAVATLPLARWLHRERPPWMLPGMVESNCIALSAKLISRSRTKIIVRQENVISQAARRPATLVSRICMSLAPTLYPHADAIIAISDGVREDLARFTGLPLRRIRTVYNPACPVPELLAGPPATHRWLGPGKDRPVLLCAGRLVEVKDFAGAIRAFAMVRARRPARLIILGQGPLLGQLQALADGLGCREDVEFAGFQQDPYAFMRACDAFLLSSASEGFGNVLVEALACGMRIVSTDCPGGPREILDQGRYGRLVPVGDPSAMSQALLAALDEPPHPQARLRAADFAAQAIAARYLQVIADAG